MRTGRKPTSAWGLRKGAVGTAEERFGIGEDDGGGDGSGVVAAEGGGRAASDPVGAYYVGTSPSSRLCRAVPP